MNNNTNQTKVSLEEITGTYKGTTEYKANIDLGVKRNEITGILATDKRAKAFKMTANVAKPLSILFSAFGFATIVAGVSDHPLFSVVWWILLILGLSVGVLFEYVSTANEDSFINIDNKMKLTGIILIVVIKSYAVFMHYQTSEQLSRYLTANITADTVEETPRAKLLKSQIATLKKDIEDKKAEKKTEAYAQLVINTTSTHNKKRDDAQKAIDKIENSLKILQDKKESKELELTELTEGNIADTKQDKENNSKGLIWTFLGLLVMVELGGTLMSVLYKQTVLHGVDDTIALTKEVKSRLYNKKVANEEINNKLKSFDVANKITSNHNAIELLEFESTIKENEIKINERVRLIEQHKINKELELRAKFDELEALKYDKLINQIDRKLSMISEIDTPLIITERKEKPQRKMGFATNEKISDIEMLTRLYADGTIKEGEKLEPKSMVVNVKRRVENQRLTDFYKKLEEKNIVEFQRGLGYFAKADYQTALNLVGGEM